MRSRSGCARPRNAMGLRAAAACLALAAACAASVASAQDNQRVKVLASYSILADWARQIGGNRVAVETLVPPLADMHSFRLRPAHMLAASRADVMVFNGLGFEGWIERIGKASDFAGVVAIASDGIDGLPIRKPSGSDEHDHETDVASGIDPHAWHNPRNAIVYARNIADSLSRADPAGADVYAANLAAYETKLQQLDRELADMFAALPPLRRLVIVPHDGYRYLGRAYGLEFRALEPGSASAASARDAAELVRLAEERGIRTAFVDAVGDGRRFQALLAEGGVESVSVLYGDTLSDEDGPAPDYMAMMRHNARMIVEGLRAR